MNEAERREFLTQFIEKVEIYEEEQENGQWLKSIEFKLPIISKDMKISLDNGSHVETVVLLSQQNPDDSRQPETTPEKERAITEALKHFKMIIE